MAQHQQRRRLTGYDDQIIASFSNPFTNQSFQFSSADELWLSMQKGIEKFVKHGFDGIGGAGNATIQIPLRFRPDWNEVKKMLLNKKIYKVCNY